VREGIYHKGQEGGKNEKKPRRLVKRSEKPTPRNLPSQPRSIGRTTEGDVGQVGGKKRIEGKKFSEKGVGGEKPRQPGSVGGCHKLNTSRGKNVGCLKKKKGKGRALGKEILQVNESTRKKYRRSHLLSNDPAEGSRRGKNLLASTKEKKWSLPMR